MIPFLSGRASLLLSSPVMVRVVVVVVVVVVDLVFVVLVAWVSEQAHACVGRYGLHNILSQNATRFTCSQDGTVEPLEGLLPSSW